MYYLNWDYNGSVECIDETETERDAVYLANEYRMAYGGLGTITIDAEPAGGE